MKSQLFAAVLLAGVSTFASATGIVSGTGWQEDEISTAGTASLNSAWTFTVASGTEAFRVVDCCAVGDVYKLWAGGVGGTLLATSTFYAGAPTADGGLYESYWLDSTFSKLEYLVGPGNYSFTISGDGAGGLPAGFGVQLATVAPVPEPETYALMLAGLAVVGAAARRRKAK